MPSVISARAGRVRYADRFTSEHLGSSETEILVESGGKSSKALHDCVTRCGCADRSGRSDPDRGMMTRMGARR